MKLYLLFFATLGLTQGVFGASFFDSVVQNARKEGISSEKWIEVRVFTPLEIAQEKFDEYINHQTSFDSMISSVRDFLDRNRGWKEFFILLVENKDRIDEEEFFILKNIFTIPFLNFLDHAFLRLSLVRGSYYNSMWFDPDQDAILADRFLVDTRARFFKKLKKDWDSEKDISILEAISENDGLLIDRMLAEFSSYDHDFLARNGETKIEELIASVSRSPRPFKDIYLLSLINSQEAFLGLLRGIKVWIEDETIPLYDKKDLLRELTKRLIFARMRFKPTHSYIERKYIDILSALTEELILFPEVSVFEKITIASTLYDSPENESMFLNEKWEKVKKAVLISIINDGRAKAEDIHLCAQRLSLLPGNIEEKLNAWKRLTTDFILLPHQLKDAARAFKDLGEVSLSADIWDKIVKHGD